MIALHNKKEEGREIDEIRKNTRVYWTTRKSKVRRGEHCNPEWVGNRRQRGKEMIRRWPSIQPPREREEGQTQGFQLARKKRPQYPKAKRKKGWII